MLKDDKKLILTNKYGDSFKKEGNSYLNIEARLISADKKGEIKMGIFKRKLSKDDVVLIDSEREYKGKLQGRFNKIVFFGKQRLEIEFGSSNFLTKSKNNTDDYDLKVEINYKNDNTNELKTLAVFLMSEMKFKEIEKILNDTKRKVNEDEMELKLTLDADKVEYLKREVALLRLSDDDMIEKYNYGKLDINENNLFFKSTYDSDYTIDLNQQIYRVIGTEAEISGYNYWVGIYTEDKNGEYVKHATFLTKEDKMNEIKDAINRSNQKHVEKYVDSLSNFKFMVSETAELLISNNDIYQITYNFVEETDKSIFLNLMNFITFERLLFESDNIGKLILQTNSYDKDVLDLPLEEFEKIYKDINLERILTFLNEEFIMLHKIVSRKTKIEINLFITWMILVKVAQDYFHSLFRDEYGGYFDNLNQLSLDNCLEKYMRIELINIDSVQNTSVFTYFLMCENKLEENSNFLICNKIVLNELVNRLEEKKLDDFEFKLLSNNNIGTKEVSIEIIDLMSGIEFEKFIASLFNQMGFFVEVTKASGDQGIDVIIEKNGQKIGVQTKCYAGTVSNKAIQEVVAGLRYYGLSKGMVITNSYFTESAIKLAESNEVVLWDRDMLKNKLNENY